jgi:high-affinity Fe2+/Pb2+ permease
MRAEEWIHEEQVKALKQAVAVRHFATGLIVALALGFLFVSGGFVQSSRFFTAVTLQATSLGLLLVAAHMVTKSLDYRRRIMALVDQQESELKLATARMFSAIEQNLGDSNPHG